MDEPKKEIKIECKGAATVRIEELSEFQGEIKNLSPENYKKLHRSILRYGFTAPIFIWSHEDKRDIIDGHQRLKVLLGLRDEGYGIPEIPVVYIFAKTAAEAKRRVLLISSQYGKFEKSKLGGFIKEINESISEIVKEVEIPELKIPPIEPPKVEGGVAPKRCPTCGRFLPNT